MLSKAVALEQGKTSQKSCLTRNQDLRRNQASWSGN
jgi:hypothetical protein